MLENIEKVSPQDIEKRSFEIISEIMGPRTFPPLHEPIIKRVIHTTADFDYTDSLKFDENAVEKGMEAIRSGFNIVTDTKMAEAGINKRALANFGGRVICLMDDEKIAEKAKDRGVTRASICMEEASASKDNKIFVIGNAPTALIRLYELIKEGLVSPSLVIGVPVGFVNVVESKALIKKAGIPYIVSEGRKGGSNVAAAIVNAILYMMR
ncbi:MAG: precorrin-8X methylmutase [Bacillota bacterium]